MGKVNFDKVLEDYVFRPEVFWPENNVFHKRNRDKIAKARARVKGVEAQELLSRLKSDLEERYEKQKKTLYVISCGSSGCHFLGEMLSSIGSFDLVKEVYYPPFLQRLCRDTNNELSEQERRMLFDLVSYFPSRGIERGDSNVVPINIMHLRGDTPTSFVKEMGGHHLILLMRNPFDIAYSRSFRKEEYRSEADPNASDKDYLVKQINNVKRFYRLASEESNIFDDVVRYEDLIEAPYKAVHDLVLVAKEKFPEAWGSADDLSKARDHVESEGSINYNSKKKRDVGEEYAQLLREGLGELADNLGYSCPSYIK